MRVMFVVDSLRFPCQYLNEIFSLYLVSQGSCECASGIGQMRTDTDERKEEKKKHGERQLKVSLTIKTKIESWICNM